MKSGNPAAVRDPPWSDAGGMIPQKYSHMLGPNWAKHAYGHTQERVGREQQEHDDIHGPER